MYVGFPEQLKGLNIEYSSESVARLGCIPF